MKKKIPFIFLTTALLTGLIALSCHSKPASIEKIWSEKANDTPMLVNVPNFRPVIKVMDPTIVNVAGTSEPKQVKQQIQRRGQNGNGNGREAPLDPFGDPQEFFERFFGGPMQEAPQQPRRTLGSGFIISKDGYILTNNHVVEGSDKIEITLMPEEKGKKGKTFQATIIGRDPGTDVALLKIKTGFDLPFAFLGDSSSVDKGDWVLAFGNPFGLDHSVSHGIISAKGREISPNENRRYDDFIQTDAAINFGNSGGPLVDMKGEVIGINTAITAQGSGIGFAVPISIAKDVTDQLQRNGSVVRGYLGVMIQDLTDATREALLPKTFQKGISGVLVNDLVPSGPAAKAGIKRGDIILKVNGIEVDAKDLQRQVAKVPPGESVKLTVVREKKAPIEVSVKVGNLKEGEAKETTPEQEPEAVGKADRLGISVESSESGGVQITKIEPESAAASAEPDIAPGDIIQGVNGVPVKSVSQYSSEVKKLESKKPVVLDLARGEHGHFYVGFKVP